MALAENNNLTRLEVVFWGQLFTCAAPDGGPCFMDEKIRSRPDDYNGGYL